MPAESLTSPRVLAATSWMIAYPCRSLSVMKGAGHFPMLEDPARFNELLAGVFRDLRK